MDWRKQIQHCKANILQFKKKKNGLKELGWSLPKQEMKRTELRLWDQTGRGGLMQSEQNLM